MVVLISITPVPSVAVLSVGLLSDELQSGRVSETYPRSRDRVREGDLGTGCFRTGSPTLGPSRSREGDSF